MNAIRTDFSAPSAGPARSQLSKNGSAGGFEELLNSTIKGQAGETSESGAEIATGSAAQRLSEEKEKSQTVQYSLISSSRVVESQVLATAAGADRPDNVEATGSGFAVEITASETDATLQAEVLGDLTRQVAGDPQAATALPLPDFAAPPLDGKVPLLTAAQTTEPRASTGSPSLFESSTPLVPAASPDLPATASEGNALKSSRLQDGSNTVLESGLTQREVLSVEVLNETVREGLGFPVTDGDEGVNATAGSGRSFVPQDIEGSAGETSATKNSFAFQAAAPATNLASEVEPAVVNEAASFGEVQNVTLKNPVITVAGPRDAGGLDAVSAQNTVTQPVGQSNVPEPQASRSDAVNMASAGVRESRSEELPSVGSQKSESAETVQAEKSPAPTRTEAGENLKRPGSAGFQPAASTRTKANAADSVESAPSIRSQENETSKGDPIRGNAESSEASSASATPPVVKSVVSTQTPGGQNGRAGHEDSRQANASKVENTTPITQQAVASASAPGETNAVEPTRSPAPRQIDAGHVIDQIATGAKNQSGVSELRIMLRPEHLGLVHIRLAKLAGQLTATITTASDAVRQTLEQHLPQLQASLAESGAHVTEISVSTSHSPMGFHDGQSSRHSGSDQRPARTYRSLADTSSPIETVAAVATVSDQGVNVLA